MSDETHRLEAYKHFQRGLVLEQAGRFDEAAEEFRRAIAYNPHMREAHDAMAFYYQRHGLFAKAVDELRTVAALGDDADAYYNLGAMLAEMGRFEAAEQALQRCLELDPADMGARLELAQTRYSLGRYAEARTLLEELLSQIPGEAQAHLLLGRCLSRLGQPQEALNSYSRALLHTDDPETRAELSEAIAVAKRQLEFRQINGIKDRLYIDEGTVCLGSARDDGLLIPVYDEYRFEARDTAVTLGRLELLARALRWPISGVVALDRAAQPLAHVAAELLGLPMRRTRHLNPDDHVLLVGGIITEPEFLAAALEQMPCDATAFSLAITWDNHPTVAPPHILGVLAKRAELPWEEDLRGLLRRGASAEDIDRLLADAAALLLAEVTALEPEPNADRQVRYYARQHRRIDAF